MTMMQQPSEPKEPVKADLTIASLREGYEALEWCSRQWTLCVLKEARDNGITRQELDILRKGISDGRKAFIEAWEKFVAVRTGQVSLEVKGEGT